MELLTAAQMRAIERAAIQSGEVTGLDLMERAGRGVVEAILEWRPELAEGERSAVVLCGPGNNGGDGFVVARLLKARGWAVQVFLYGDEAKLPPDAAENARRWQQEDSAGSSGNVTIVGASDASPLKRREIETSFGGETIETVNIVVDALLGTGLTRPIAGAMHATISEVIPSSLSPLMALRNRVVAIDARSGLDLDSGRVLGPDYLKMGEAGLTVTFHSPKAGHVLADGPALSGQLVVKDIGLWPVANRMRWDGIAPVRLCEGPTARMAAKAVGHKYSHGHALVLSGNIGRTGAARLAARAALRIGAGLVTVGSPSEAMAENAAHLTAIMLREIGTMDDLGEALEDERIDAVCLGPGLGVGHGTELFVKQVLEAGRATVLDADALTVFADDPPALFDRLHEKCILTPHEGEFGRLFPDILDMLNAPATTGPAYSKVDATREAAARAGCAVLFKGPDTVIAAPDGRCAINSAHYERAAPWLATAGSGDVLAGMIAGLLARGLDPMSAAESAAWLHVDAGRHLGPGLIAEDIPEALPDVLKRVLNWSPPPSSHGA